MPQGNSIKALALKVLRNAAIIGQGPQTCSTPISEDVEHGMEQSVEHAQFCAGCYSIGVIDGRERFIHPPKGKCLQ